MGHDPDHCFFLYFKPHPQIIDKSCQTSNDITKVYPLHVELISDNLYDFQD